MPVLKLALICFTIVRKISLQHETFFVSRFPQRQNTKQFVPNLGPLRIWHRLSPGKSIKITFLLRYTSVIMEVNMFVLVEIIRLYNLFILSDVRSRDSSVGVETTLRAGRPRNRSSIPGRCKRPLSSAGCQLRGRSSEQNNVSSGCLRLKNINSVNRRCSDDYFYSCSFYFLFFCPFMFIKEWINQTKGNRKEKINTNKPEDNRN
jgi:hypothetical protein